MLENIISAIGQSYETSRTIYNIFGSVLGIMTIYKTVYFLIGLFFTRKFKPAKNKHKYGILIAARNEEAVISPSWSIHSASATHAYTFIWGMVGENQDFDDMDDVDMKDLR